VRQRRCLVLVRTFLRAPVTYDQFLIASHGRGRREPPLSANIGRIRPSLATFGLNRRALHDDAAGASRSSDGRRKQNDVDEVRDAETAQAAKLVRRVGTISASATMLPRGRPSAPRFRRLNNKVKLQRATATPQSLLVCMVPARMWLPPRPSSGHFSLSPSGLSRRSDAPVTHCLSPARSRVGVLNRLRG
jgi:hypothetical protein